MTHATFTNLVTVCAIVTALAAGVRSTWSPCGVSMLSTITPLAESGRGHRWLATATWYFTGGVAGGATLGAVLALLAAGVHGLVPATPTAVTTTALVAAGLTLLGAAGEAGVASLPIHHRQVNERWLDAYRPWVYATGFGWQIGTGVATYVKTSAVYVLIALAALTGDPLVAWSVGLLFGLVRGLAVFTSRGITTTSALASFHRRFMELDRPARAAVVVIEMAVALVLSWIVSPWFTLVAVATLIAAMAVAVLTRSRRDRRRRGPRHPAPLATSPGGSRSARTA
jgi:MFS family permease